MNKKFIDSKNEAENKIHNILQSFKDETGVSINYMNFAKENKTGFNSKEKFTTKIMLKNE